jgi:phosphoglycerate dehydrogenase-like enzyme
MTRRIVVLGGAFDAEYCVSQLHKTLREELRGWELFQGSEALENIRLAEIIFGWNGSINTSELFEANVLRWIHLPFAGIDFLPLAELERRNIFLTTSHGVHAKPISESVFGMLLAFSRQLFALRDEQQKNIWNHRLSGGKNFIELHHKTIGILGVGAIGQEVAKIAKGFDMRVLGFSRTKKAQRNIDVFFGSGDLYQLLSESDFVINTLPLTPQTRKIMDDQSFAAMKSIAFYVNVGRGKTTDTPALIQALKEGKIAGAGLDVIDPEPLENDSPLWQMPNVFIGAHSSNASEFNDRRVLEIFADNLVSYIRGYVPGRNLISFAVGY